MPGIRLKRGEYRASAGRYYGTPKEVWGFRTRASSQPVTKTATETRTKTTVNGIMTDARRALALLWARG